MKGRSNRYRYLTESCRLMRGAREGKGEYILELCAELHGIVGCNGVASVIAQEYCMILMEACNVSYMRIKVVTRVDSSSFDREGRDFFVPLKKIRIR